MREPRTPQARENLQDTCWQLSHEAQAAAREAEQLRDQLAAADAEIARLRTGIEELRLSHADSWCSAHAGHRCNCGADLHNATIDALLAQ